MTILYFILISLAVFLPSKKEGINSRFVAINFTFINLIAISLIFGISLLCGINYLNFIIFNFVTFIGTLTFLGYLVIKPRINKSTE